MSDTLFEICQGSPIDIDIGETKAIDLDISQTDGLTLDLDTKTTSYSALTGKPSINGVTIVGHKLGEDYKLQDILGTVTEQDIDKIIFGG